MLDMLKLTGRKKDFLRKKKIGHCLKCQILFDIENDNNDGDPYDDKSESRCSTGSNGRPLSRSSFQALRIGDIRQQYNSEELNYAT